MAQRPRFIALAPWLWAALAAVAAAGCAPGELGRVRVCEQALRALVAGAEPLRHQTAPRATVVVFFREAARAEQALVCRFRPRGLESDGLELVEVLVPQGGPVSPTTLFLLKTYGLAGAPADDARLPGWAYLAQQLANALAPAAIYALLAAGFSVIYGVTGRINLAFGEFTAVGAFAALAGILAGAAAGPGAPLLAAAGLALAGATGAALGTTLHGLVFRPLQQRGTQALLIATVGLAILLSEALRLLTGSRQRWLQPFFTAPLRIGPVVVSPSQLGLAALAGAAVAAVGVLLRRSAFGRAYRACADDMGAAALVGVDVERVTRGACVLGGVLAAAAGFVVAVHYGVVSFAMGTLLGLKALTAAVVGGIGSVPGAALGGVLVGLFESLWAGYLPGDYREVALFAVLALALALRPDGLLGRPQAAVGAHARRVPPP